MYKNIYILLIFVSISFSENIIKNETLIYETKIKSLGFLKATVGSSEFILKSSESEYELIIKTESNKFFDRIYKVREYINMRLDSNLSLINLKRTNKGKDKVEINASVNMKDKIVSFGKKDLKYNSNRIFYPYSLIYALRNRSLRIGEKYLFSIFDDKDIIDVNLHITSTETITVPYGKFNCFVAEPHSENNENLFKNKGQMKIWYSDDETSIPIKIEINSNIGTIIMNLKKKIID